MQLAADSASNILHRWLCRTAQLRALLLTRQDSASPCWQTAGAELGLAVPHTAISQEERASERALEARGEDRLGEEGGPRGMLVCCSRCAFRSRVLLWHSRHLCAAGAGQTAATHGLWQQQLVVLRTTVRDWWPSSATYRCLTSSGSVKGSSRQHGQKRSVLERLYPPSCRSAGHSTGVRSLSTAAQKQSHVGEASWT